MSGAMPLTEAISQSSSKKRTYKTLTAKFGSYDSTAPDGIRPVQDEWSIVYDNLTVAELGTVYAVLDAIGGWDYMTWTPPGETSKKWKVTSEVMQTPTSGEHYNLSFTIRQTY